MKQETGFFDALWIVICGIVKFYLYVALIMFIITFIGMFFI